MTAGRDMSGDGSLRNGGGEEREQEKLYYFFIYGSREREREERYEGRLLWVWDYVTCICPQGFCERASTQSCSEWLTGCIGTKRAFSLSRFRTQKDRCSFPSFVKSIFHYNKWNFFKYLFCTTVLLHSLSLIKIIKNKIKIKKALYFISEILKSRPAYSLDILFLLIK